MHQLLAKANYNTISIHGDKNHIKRQEAISKFSSGEIPILIATNIASRGIDFPNVSYIFNFDMPTNIDDYIHRSGRTGRCGNRGRAISIICSNSKPILTDLRNLLISLGQNTPNWFNEFVINYEKEKEKSMPLLI